MLPIYADNNIYTRPYNLSETTPKSRRSSLSLKKVSARRQTSVAQGFAFISTIVPRGLNLKGASTMVKSPSAQIFAAANVWISSTGAPPVFKTLNSCPMFSKIAQATHSAFPAIVVRVFASRPPPSVPLWVTVVITPPNVVRAGVIFTPFLKIAFACLQKRTRPIPMNRVRQGE